MNRHRPCSARLQGASRVRRTGEEPYSGHWSGLFLAFSHFLSQAVTAEVTPPLIWSGAGLASSVGGSPTARGALFTRCSPGFGTTEHDPASPRVRRVSWWYVAPRRGPLRRVMLIMAVASHAGGAPVPWPFRGCGEIWGDGNTRRRTGQTLVRRHEADWRETWSIRFRRVALRAGPRCTGSILRQQFGAAGVVSAQSVLLLLWRWPRRYPVLRLDRQTWP